MKELEYPFDAAWIIANRRKLRKHLLESKEGLIEKKVAVLGGSTTANIVQMLELFLLHHGIRAVFYESEYGRFYEDGVFENTKLEAFEPDIIYVYTTNRNVTAFPTLTATGEEIDSLLEAQLQRFEMLWEQLAARYRCPVIQNNFELPLYRLLGNKDATDKHGAVNFLSRLNQRFHEYAECHNDFFICDIHYLSADYGLKEWSDPFYWYMYKYAININAIPYLAFSVANIIKSVFGKNKKGFVLDMDNTLWGGVIGDEGAENIQIGPETATGQVYSEFQEYIKAHKQLGILLNINSKNEEKNALAGLAHPNSGLTAADFAVVKANWESKDKNYIEIAEQLNLLPESLVFVDDNPAERHIVREQVPGVSAPTLGESHEYIRNIDRNGYFETTYLSNDDMKRSEMYAENAKRAQLQAKFSDYADYLKSLEMKAVIKGFEPMYMARIAQLTNKSNQFNLTTKRYTQGEIEEIARDERFITLYGKLKDRFGDNGVVSVCIGRIEEGICHIELLVMSCRVLKREMEYAMMDALIWQCMRAGIFELRGYYYPTAKNGIVKDFYETMGFDKISEMPDGSVWSLKLSDGYIEKNKYICVEAAE